MLQISNFAPPPQALKANHHREGANHYEIEILKEQVRDLASDVRGIKLKPLSFPNIPIEDLRAELKTALEKFEAKMKELEEAIGENPSTRQSSMLRELREKVNPKY